MNSIDPADYVEAPEGQNSLKFQDEKQQARFELGVCMALAKWEELTIAVDNLWGGPNSNEKRDWMAGIVVDLFDEKVVDIQYIEETLLYAMLDEFDVQIDNDSALEIGALVMKFYKNVLVQDYNTIDELYSKWLAKQESRQVNKVKLNSDPNNPSSDEDEDEDDDDDIEVVIGNDQAQYQQEAQDDSMDVDNGPVVDDDGFTLVQNKKGSKRR